MHRLDVLKVSPLQLKLLRLPKQPPLKDRLAQLQHGWVHYLQALPTSESEYCERQRQH